jgi:hypothetical protein
VFTASAAPAQAGWPIHPLRRFRRVSESVLSEVFGGRQAGCRGGEVCPVRSIGARKRETSPARGEDHDYAPGVRRSPPVALAPSERLGLIGVTPVSIFGSAQLVNSAARCLAAATVSSPA